MPRHRFMSAYEQRIEPPDRRWQYLLMAAEPYETIAFKVAPTGSPSSHPPVGRSLWKAGELCEPTAGGWASRGGSPPKGREPDVTLVGRHPCVARLFGDP